MCFPRTPHGILIFMDHVFGVYAANSQGRYYILCDAFYDTSDNNLPVPESNTLALLCIGAVAGMLILRKTSENTKNFP